MISKKLSVIISTLIVLVLAAIKIDVPEELIVKLITGIAGLYVVIQGIIDAIKASKK